MKVQSSARPALVAFLATEVPPVLIKFNLRGCWSKELETTSGREKKGHNLSVTLEDLGEVCCIESNRYYREDGIFETARQNGRLSNWVALYWLQPSGSSNKSQSQNISAMLTYRSFYEEERCAQIPVGRTFSLCASNSRCISSVCKSKASRCFA